MVDALDSKGLVEELVAMMRASFDHADDSMGCTMVAAIVDRNASTLAYLSAGHLHMECVFTELPA